MLDLTVRLEAHALLAYWQDGDDPEPTSEQWHAASIEEMARVIREARGINPAVAEGEWLGDFTAAHRWLRRNRRTTHTYLTAEVMGR